MPGTGRRENTIQRNFFRLNTTQQFPIDLDAAWNFFSNPLNLEEITPPELHLVVEIELPSRMHPGALICYRVKPLPEIPVHWVTEITHVEEGRFFVDEQRFGPYLSWRHQHHFQPIEGGVEMRDFIHYKLPLGLFSFLVGSFVVSSQLRRIFSYREEALAQRFGRMN